MMLESAQSLSRRKFLRSSFCLAGATALLPGGLSAAKPSSNTRFKATIIGHTGRGDYGHEMDLIFNERPSIEVVAVADLDDSGRAKSAARCGARRQYTDYREMLEKEKPQLVCVAPRWTDQHHAMTLAALRAGAHVFSEKPFTQTLAQADELLAVADKMSLKIAVAHQMRLAPSILHLKRALDAGLIGDLLEVRAHGKQDSRAGGEDMVVLGTHLFDLMRFFAGDAVWCTARVLQKGREVTWDDVHDATENIGPIVGDEIEAQFAFATGVNGHFTSRGRNRQTAGPWGIQLIGSKGVVRILTEVFPSVYLLKSGEWSASGKSDAWSRLPDDPALTVPAAERAFSAANRRVVDDWLGAIQQNREPVCSGRAATKSLEMIMAVFQAGITGTRVTFPMAQREHPLKAKA